LNSKVSFGAGFLSREIKILSLYFSSFHSSNFAFYRNPLQRIPTMEVKDFSAADGDGIFNEHRMNSMSSEYFKNTVQCTLTIHTHLFVCKTKLTMHHFCKIITFIFKEIAKCSCTN
jgi:hypothetical protein